MSKLHTITEDTPVAWVNGKEVLADHLQKWAYNQLEIAPAMYEICKMTLIHIKETGINAWNSDLFDSCQSILAKLEE